MHHPGKELLKPKVGNKSLFPPEAMHHPGKWTFKTQGRNISVDEPDYSDPRVLGINVCIYGFKTRFVNVYSPTNIDGTANQKDEFYRKVKKACDLKRKHHKLIVLGDFNAQTSVAYKQCLFDVKTIIEDNECNDNGNRLKHFCRYKELCMPQTHFNHPVEERYTWFSNDGKTKKILDYVLVEKYVQQYISECAVDQSCLVESDHRLLITSLKTPMNKKARWKVPKANREKKLNMKVLREDVIKLEFVNQLTENLKNTPVGEESSSLISDKVINGLNLPAKTVLQAKDSIKVKEIWKDDFQLNNLLNERATLDRMSNELKNSMKEITNRVMHLRTEKIKKEAEEINTFANKKQIEELSRLFKSDA